MLDADEVDGLIKTFQYIKDNVLPTAAERYTEYTYRSRGHFEAGCYWKDRPGKWQIYIEVDKYKSGSTVNVDAKDLDVMIEMFQSSKTKIESFD
jgi:hypothetical protein